MKFDSDEIRYLYEVECWTLRDIAAEAGCSYEWIRVLLLRAGVSLRGRMEAPRGAALHGMDRREAMLAKIARAKQATKVTSPEECGEG